MFEFISKSISPTFIPNKRFFESETRQSTHQTMLSTSTQIGSTTQGTTFADIITNCVSATADGAIQGFASFVHDPASLKQAVSVFAKAATPKKFADAVVLRRMETQKLDDIWDFPLNLSVQ